MSTRLEDDLRSALAGATPPPTLTLHPDTVLRQGRRVVRTRRLVQAGVVAVAVAAIAVAGTQLAAPRHSGAPASTQDRSGQPPIAVLHLGVGSYAVSLQDQDDEHETFDLYRVGGAGRMTMVGSVSTTPLGPDRALWSQVTGTNVVLGVLPAGARHVMAAVEGDWPSTIPVTTVPLPGTDFDAFATVVPPVPADQAPLGRLVWTTPSGTVRGYPASAGVAFQLSGGAKLTIDLDRSGTTPTMTAQISEGGRLARLGTSRPPAQSGQPWRHVVTTPGHRVIVYGIEPVAAPYLAALPGRDLRTVAGGIEVTRLPGEDYRAWVYELTPVDGSRPSVKDLPDIGYVDAPPTWRGPVYH